MSYEQQVDQLYTEAMADIISWRRSAIRSKVDLLRQQRGQMETERDAAQLLVAGMQSEAADLIRSRHASKQGTTPKVWTDDDAPKPAPAYDPMYIHREHDPGTDAELRELRADNERLRGELTRLRSELRALLEGNDNES
jgi:hypothetical protein